MSSTASIDSNPHTSLPPSIILEQLNDSANNPEFLLKLLISCVMRTFYNIPQSLVLEYIYHYGEINL
jgi:hypothetical protein